MQTGREMLFGKPVRRLDERHIRCPICRREACEISRAKLRQHLMKNWTRSWKRRRGRPCVPPTDFWIPGGVRGYWCPRHSPHHGPFLTHPEEPRLPRSPNGIRRCLRCRVVPDGKLHKNELCDECNEEKQHRRRVLKCRRQRLRKRRAKARGPGRNPS